MAKQLPPWCKEVQKAMIDKGMDTTDLAIQMGCTRQYVAAIINGRMHSSEKAIKISKILEINAPEGSTLCT